MGAVPECTTWFGGGQDGGVLTFTQVDGVVSFFYCHGFWLVRNWLGGGGLILVKFYGGVVEF